MHGVEAERHFGVEEGLVGPRNALQDSRPHLLVGYPTQHGQRLVAVEDHHVHLYPLPHGMGGREAESCVRWREARLVEP